MSSKKQAVVATSVIVLVAAAFGGMLWTLARLTDNNDVFKQYTKVSEGEQVDVVPAPMESEKAELDESILEAAATRRFSNSQG